MTDLEKQASEVQASIQESFQYQLELLKKEIDIIDNAIARIDGITQTIKHWTIVTWAGLVAVALGQQPDLRKYIIFTAILPILFWALDARWRYYLRGFIFRQDMIARFLNSQDLVKSFEQQKLIGLTLLDPRGAQHRKTDDYKQLVNMWRSIRYPEVSIFYLSLIFISVGFGMFFLVTT